MDATGLSTLHFRKVIGCQFACPAHTPVPQYIGLIAEGKFADAYMVNWRANVFPGILGRTCDRPCEPACRRGRVEHEPVAICRLKRSAADFKGDIRAQLPHPPKVRNGKRVALVGAGPASLTVARDLALLGYACAIIDEQAKPGGMMRSRIPQFRLPQAVLDEETGNVLGLGVEFRSTNPVPSLKQLLCEGWDAVFVGAGAPRGQDLDLPGRNDARRDIHIGIEWLANVRFEHITSAGRRMVVIGGGKTAMDCARSALRLGSEEVHVVARSSHQDMKASVWERDEALREGVNILSDLLPRKFDHSDGHVRGVWFEPVHSTYEGGHRTLAPTGSPWQFIACDQVLIAAGQERAFPWIERDLGLEFKPDGMPLIDAQTLRSTHPRVFFGGDAAFGPRNIITAIAQGHEAAISIDLVLSGKNPARRPEPTLTWTRQQSPAVVNLIPEIDRAPRTVMPTRPADQSLHQIGAEVELGFDRAQAAAEARRCMHCELETVFITRLCVECKACETICPTDCITFTTNGDESDLRPRLKMPALNRQEDLYVSDVLISGRVMVKSEDACLHCGLCAQNCPTDGWQMHQLLFEIPLAGAKPLAATIGGMHG